MKVERLAEQRCVRAKKTVLRRGDESLGVYFLLSGAVRVCEANNLLVKLLCAPAMFGEIEALSGECRRDAVICVETSHMLVLPAHAFRFLLDHAPAFAAAVARDLAKRLSIAATNQSSLAFDDVQARLARLLLDYAICVGEPWGDGRRIVAVITQDSLAQDLGVSRKAVATVLRRFRSFGLLRKEDARYTLPDLDGLEALQTRRMSLQHRCA